MFFGSTTFASAPFSDIGIANALVDVTGSQVNTSIGNVTIVGNALVLPNGNRYNLSTGTVTIQAKATVLPTGSELEVSVPTSINIKQWDGVVPGVSQTWTRIQTP